MSYLPKHEILSEIVESFNKRDDTYISYMRSQYNALENYVQAYCIDHDKYLVARNGVVTGINYKFRNALSEVIITKKEAVKFLNSKEVNTLYHFTPMIYEEDSGSTLKHETFRTSYDLFREKPNDYRSQKKVLVDLCSLLYMVRCNVAHTGKTSRGPNRTKIERDMAIARLITDINRSIFCVLMDHPERKIACYGSLKNSIFVSGMKELDGIVNGYVDYDVNKIAYFTYEFNTGNVAVKLYTSPNAIDFKDMDMYEGNSYERIYIPVYCGNKIQIANIYERKYSYE